jgi:hypothetical protein
MPSAINGSAAIVAGAPVSKDQLRQLFDTIRSEVGHAGFAPLMPGAPERTGVEKLKDFPSILDAMSREQREDAVLNPNTPRVSGKDAWARAMANTPAGGRVIINAPVYIDGNDEASKLFLTKPNVTVEFTRGGGLYFDDLSGGTSNPVNYLKVLADGVRLLWPRIVQLNPPQDKGYRSARAAIHVGNEDGSMLGTPVAVNGFECFYPYIYGTCGAGILLEMAKNFQIVGAHIENTLADGIHISRASSQGIVLGANIIHTGDDGFAVVGNTKSSDCNRRIYAAGLNIFNTGGRGAVVLGGEDVFIEALIENTSGSGFYIHRESNAVYDLRPTRRVTLKGRVKGAGLGYDAQPTNPKAGVLIGAAAEDITLDVDVTDAQTNVALIGDSAAPPRTIKGSVRGKNCRSGILISSALDVQAELIAEECGSNGVNLVNCSDSQIPRIAVRHNNIDRTGNNIAQVRLKGCSKLTVGLVDTQDLLWRLPYDNATRIGTFPRGARITGSVSGSAGILVADHNNWSGSSSHWLCVRDPSPAVPAFLATATPDVLTATLAGAKNPGALTIGNGKTSSFNIGVFGLTTDMIGVTYSLTTPNGLPAGVTAAVTMAGYEAVTVAITNGSGASRTLAAGTYTVVATVGSAVMNAAQAQFTTANQIYVDSDCSDVRVANRRLIGGSGAPVINFSASCAIPLTEPTNQAQPQLLYENTNNIGGTLDGILPSLAGTPTLPNLAEAARECAERFNTLLRRSVSSRWLAALSEGGVALAGPFTGNLPDLSGTPTAATVATALRECANRLNLVATGATPLAPLTENNAAIAPQSFNLPGLGSPTMPNLVTSVRAVAHALNQYLTW